MKETWPTYNNKEMHKNAVSSSKSMTWGFLRLGSYFVISPLQHGVEYTTNMESVLELCHLTDVQATVITHIYGLLNEIIIIIIIIIKHLPHSCNLTTGNTPDYKCSVTSRTIRHH